MAKAKRATPTDGRAVFFRVTADEATAIGDFAERLKLKRMVAARRMVLWALEQLDGDPSRLFAEAERKRS